MINTPYKADMGQIINTNVAHVNADRGFVAHIHLDSVLASDVDIVHAAVTDTGVQVVKTTNITNPDTPRNITATAGGTAGDIKAVQVIVAGTNYKDEVITETLSAFTVNTAGTVVGSKAFKTVTSITIPPHDGTGATTSIGIGDKIGLPYKLAHNTVLKAYLNDVLEATSPTITVSTTAIESNTADLNSALDGTDVDIYLVV